ncbi:hypothetical protein PsorP6_016902 [Peronosclerospora sorghi]|uniref:Uncharacterized protein n=1 Tax=Peronosclerospora sorghi TaxID=230839 RepID=A0ACC0WDC8_9STRA|nr:hypothetical protein PsorP6_016902 [Peronosclerospora sorghi]
MCSMPPPVPAPTSTPATGSVPEAPSVPTGQQPKQDEWASFGGSTNAQSGFKDAFAAQAPAPVDQHANKIANIMASFGTMTQQQPPQQQQQPQRNAFPPQQGMTPAGSMMEMHMNGMGMMQPRPMGMSLPMNMPMGGQPFMNPMMGHQANLMMGYPMQNQMFGAPQQNGLMMGVAAPRGFPTPPMGMNPMGMHMNMGGFQQQQQLQQQQLQQQQQQQHQQQQLQVGGLSQPFVNFG